MSGEFLRPDLDPSSRLSWPEIWQALDALRERLARLERGARGPAEGAAVPPTTDPDLQALTVVQDILSIPASGLDPAELFALAMDRTSRLLAADRAMLFVAEPGGGRLVARSAHGFRRDDLMSITMHPGEGMVGRAFKERRVLTYTSGTDGEAPDEFIERFPVWAAIAVPVRAEDEVAGVLYAGRRRLGAPFGAADVLLLLVIADRISGGLVHQTLLDRRARHVARLRELAGFAGQILPAAPSDDVLAQACEVGCRLVDVRAAAIAVTSEGGELELVAGRGLPEAIESWRRVDVREGLTAELYAAAGPVACRDVQARALPERSFLGDGGFHGCLLLPLELRGRMAGVLYLADTEVRDFSAEEIEAAAVLAALAAAAVDHRRSSGELRGALDGAQSSHERLLRVEKTRALGDMAGGLARELNNIFAVILGKSRLLLARSHEEALRDGLGLMEEAAWRGADMVHRLSALAAPPSGETLDPVDLPGLVQDAIALTRPRWKDEVEARGARVEIATDLRSAPPVLANAAALRDAVVSLVANAVEAMPQGGRLSLETRPRDAGVELVVGDTGEGFPEESRDRVFDPFFTTRGPQHMGLGLTVAHGVVTRYGGRIDIGKAADGGTSVTVWLPSAPAASPAPTDDRHDARERDTGAGVVEAARGVTSILVLEDEAAVRSLLVEALTQAGHHVETAVDGLAGLARFEQRRFDVVLADLALPQRSGLAVARSVKRLSPRTPVVLITGWGHLLDPERLREHGVDLMLVKPFRLERVLSVVADALRLRFSS